MKLISSTPRYQCDIFTVTEDHAIEPGGRKIRRSIVRHRGSAVIMAVDDRKRILLVRQYRLAAGRLLWELPAGSVDEGETALQAAKRELKEETGYHARTWKKLAAFFPSPGFVTEKMTIFLATQLAEGEATPMEDERIQRHWFTARELGQAIKEGKMLDGKTLVGFLTWKNRR